MSESPRKKSPKAPSMPLDEAVSRVMAVYEKEQRNPVPTDVIAQDLGYKSANNGAALSTIASLRGYGLLARPEPGKLAVSADVQSFQYAPDEVFKEELLKKWLRSPLVFAYLLDKYVENLPSDATIRYDLIERGFKPRTAESLLKVFRKSVEFANYYKEQGNTKPNDSTPEFAEEQDERAAAPAPTFPVSADLTPVDILGSVDRIPVRLDTKRRAWLEIPTPFYDKDKDRLKAQIDLLLTDDVNRAGILGDSLV